MRRGFGLNTDLFETNILNLAVVLGIVVTVVGDSFRDLLRRRRRLIITSLQEADQKARAAAARLERAREALEADRLRSQEIRMQAMRLAEQESLSRKQQLEVDLQRLQERHCTAIAIERQRVVQTVTQQTLERALALAERTLVSACADPQWQEELNEIYVRKVLPTACKKIPSSK